MTITARHLKQLARRFRTDKGPDYEMAKYYLRMPLKELQKAIHADEGIFGLEVWAACQALKVRGKATPLSKWLLSARKRQVPQ